MNAQQLKNSILQMAVQGKLVPQDPNDEPASVLLERIRAEKEKLIKEGKIKKVKNPSYIFRDEDNLPYEKVGKNEPVCIADELPFEIPDSWMWVRLGTVIELQSGQDLAPDKYNDRHQGIPYITGASNIADSKVIINRWTEYGRAFAYKGDLLLTCKGTVGTMAFLSEDQVHIARQIMAIRPLGDINSKYIRIVLESIVVQLKAAAKSMIPGISREDVLESMFPLPPFKEQSRIVEKYNTILPYINEYELIDISIKDLNSSFPELLKKSILQQAVMGKLVPQDPNDEPASVLIKRIRAERQALIEAGKLKKDKHESIIYRRDNSHYEKINGQEVCINDEIPFEIPNTWEWVRLGSLMKAISDGTHKTPNYVENGVPFLSVQNISKGYFDLSRIKFITKEEHEKLIQRVKPEKNDILLCRIGTLGKAIKCTVDFEFSIFVSLGLLRPVDSALSDYLIFAINSPLGDKWIQDNKVGGGTHTYKINLVDLPKMLIPLPPLEEQKRIVKSHSSITPIINTL